jgi:hypothetical protein
VQSARLIHLDYVAMVSLPVNGLNYGTAVLHMCLFHAPSPRPESCEYNPHPKSYFPQNYFNTMFLSALRSSELFSSFMLPSHNFERIPHPPTRATCRPISELSFKVLMKFSSIKQTFRQTLSRHSYPSCTIHTRNLVSFSLCVVFNLFIILLT